MDYCRICLKDVEETTYCEVCGDGGMCEDCADECAELDYEYQEFDEFSDAAPGL